MAEEQTNLNDLLEKSDTPEKGETPPTETTEEKSSDTPEPSPEAKEGEKDETPSSEAETKEPEPQTVPVAALQDERKKRQAIEQRLANLEKEKTQTPRPDPFEDPEGHEKWKDNQFKQQLWQTKLDVSEGAARAQYGEEKYDTALTAFQDELANNPALLDGLRAAPSPAHYAYEQGNKAIERAELGDPATFKDRIFKEALEQARAEVKSTIDEQVKAALAGVLPQSLAEEQSQGGRSTGPVFEGPTPLDKLIGN